MSKYSDYLKKVKADSLKFFFGQDVKLSLDCKKILKFKHYINSNEIIIITNDIKVIKNNYVLLVDKNKGVYLKEWQIFKIKNWDLGINTYAIKLNRNYFKVYTFKFNFEDFIFEKEISFDDLIEIAKEQEKEEIAWKVGHYE